MAKTMSVISPDGDVVEVSKANAHDLMKRGYSVAPAKKAEDAKPVAPKPDPAPVAEVPTEVTPAVEESAKAKPAAKKTAARTKASS